MYSKLNIGLSACMFLLMLGCQTIPDQEIESNNQASAEKEVRLLIPEELEIKEIPIKTITLGFVGDILLAGSARNILEQKGYDYPFQNVQPILDQSDILFGNLEGPLTLHDEIYIEKTYTFKSDPIKTAQALKKAGFDVLSLANNHTLDYGLKGLLDTQQSLQNQEIKYMGAGQNKFEARKPVVIEKQGIKVGYLAYNNTYPKEFWASEENFGAAYGKLSEFVQDIKALELISDIQVITFHWGREGQEELRDYQPIFARAAIDAGADIVVGHHPHILQAIEQYNEGLILYSIGNFTFGTYGKLAQTSGIFNVEVSKSKVESMKMTGINIFNKDIHFRPVLLEGDEMQVLFEKVKLLSDLQNTQLEKNENQIILEF